MSNDTIVRIVSNGHEVRKGRMTTVVSILMMALYLGAVVEFLNNEGRWIEV